MKINISDNSGLAVFIVEIDDDMLTKKEYGWHDQSMV